MDSNLQKELVALTEKSDKLEKEGNEDKAPQGEAQNQQMEEVLDEWTVLANEAVHFKLVRKKEDVEDDSTTFKPEMSHQIFDDEKVKGYKGLNIQLYYSAGALSPYLKISYDEKRATPPPDDVQAALEKVIHTKPEGSLDQFLKTVEEDNARFQPPGQHFHTYTREDSETSTELSFELYKGTFDNEKVRSYHKRIQYWVLWFIDASSLIDDDDLDWEVYFLFEKRITGGEPSYAIVGYSTVYTFYNYPDKKRKRISQFLILPPWQRKGHGRELLSGIYTTARDREEIRDFTVETPSIDFTFLRDTVNCSELKKEKYFTKKPLPKLTSELSEEIRKKLKIPIEQIKRCYDIIQLKNLDESNAAEYKQFRLSIKRKLAKKYQDILSSFENPEEKKAELDKIYKEEEAGYRRVMAHFTN